MTVLILVTVAMLVVGKISWKEVPGYLISQVKRINKISIWNYTNTAREQSDRILVNCNVNALF